MAEYTIVAADVKLMSGTDEEVILGATLAQGDLVYKDAGDSGKAKLADTNSATAAARVVDGIMLTSGVAGQPGRMAKPGAKVRLTTGSAVGAASAIVILAATPGKMCPIADNATGWYTHLVGFLDATGKILSFVTRRSGIATPA